MKKFTIILIILVLLFSFICYTIPKGGINDVKLVDSEGVSISFLDLDEDITLQYGEFAFLEKRVKNTGKNPISIDRIHNINCGCSSGVDIDPRVLNPGQIGTLRMVYDTVEKKMGINQERFAIITSSKQNISIQGSVKIRIQKDIELQPLNIDLGKIVCDSKTFDMEVDIMSKIGLDIDDITVRPGSSNIKLQIVQDNTIVPTGHEKLIPAHFSLNINYLPQVTEGFINEYVVVKVANIRGRDVLFRINISGQLAPVISAEPERIFLGYIESANPVEQTIHINNAKKEAFEIINIEFPENINGSYVITDITRWKKDIKVRIGIPHIEETLGKFTLKVNLENNNTQCTTLEIPCIYIGAPNK